MFVHVLVCEAFHGKRPTWAHGCAHRDSVKTNNRENNLRWATHAENMADGTFRGPLSGESASNVILNRVQVDSIRARYEAARGAQRVKRGTRQMLAEEFGVSKRTIDAIIRGDIWK